MDEALRLEPPLQVSAFRMTREPLLVGGTKIPAGDIVLCSLTTANTDATRFPDPQRFDVRRDNNRRLSFGFGLHRCLGANLAKLEAEVAIRTVLRRHPKLRITPAAAELPWVETGIMRQLRALPTRLGPG